MTHLRSLLCVVSATVDPQLVDLHLLKVIARVGISRATSLLKTMRKENCVKKCLHLMLRVEKAMKKFSGLF